MKELMNKGFGAVEWLLVVVVVLLLGFGTWYVIDQNSNDSDTDTVQQASMDNNSDDTTAADTDDNNSATENEPSLLVFKHSYYNDETKASDINLSLSYPSDWDTRTLDGGRCTVEFLIEGSDTHTFCLLERSFGLGGEDITVEDKQFTNIEGQTYTKKLFKNTDDSNVVMVSYIPDFNVPYDALLITGIPEGEYTNFESVYEGVINSIDVVYP